MLFRSNDWVSLRISQANNTTTVKSGDKFIVMLLTSQGSSATGGSVTDAFVRRFEVRYAGGLSDFTIGQHAPLSFPGTASFAISNITLTEVNGTSVEEGNPASYNWDYIIQAAIGNSSSSAPATSAGVAEEEWQYTVAEGTDQAYGGNGASDLQTALRYLPDCVVIGEGEIGRAHV